VRARRPITAVALMLVVTGLAGCRTNVGTALRIDGHRISESSVNAYVTPDAQPVPVQLSQTKTVQAAPRSIVAQTLIDLVSYRKIIAQTPAGLPTTAQLQQVEKSLLAGKSAEAFATSNGIKGFTSAFDAKFVERQAYDSIIGQESSNGVDVQKAVSAIKISVTVSPRYGTWDRTSLSILGAKYANTPSYLTLQTPAS
jgi:hypothetical protein